MPEMAAYARVDGTQGIINLPHPTSQRHPRMPIRDRAAIFSPFAALSGHGAAIAETARLTEHRIELDEDTRAAEEVSGTGTALGFGRRGGDPAGGCGCPGERHLPNTPIVDRKREHGAVSVVLPFAVRSNQARGAGKENPMNIRKPTDYSAMYRTLDQLMGAELPQMELYFEIGRAVCSRPEKGAAVMAAEYLQANYPECKGFSLRNLRRMREFYRAYADNPVLRALALKLGWTQNAAILEGYEGSRERAWYLRAALEYNWTKAELLEQIQAGAWLQSTLDEQTDSCYTEGNTVRVECLEYEEDPFCVSWKYLSEPDGRVCDEGFGEESGTGGPVPDRLGGHQPGGNRQSGLSASPAEAGGARHLLRRPRRPAAPQSRLRGVRPAHWDGQGQPPKHVPYLRRGLQRQDAPTDGIRRPPGAGGSGPLVHRRFRRHLAGCAGRVPRAAGQFDRGMTWR